MTDPLKLITQEDSWRQEANEDVVAMLERALEAAKSGELVDVAVISTTRDNKTMTYLPQFITHHSGLLAAAQYIVHRLCVRWDHADD